MKTCEKVKSFYLFPSSEFEAHPSKDDGVDDTLGSVDRDDNDDDDGSWTTNDDQDEQDDDEARECRRRCCR